MNNRRSVFFKLRRRAGWIYRSASAGARVLPDFLIIGTPKGGTTSLYEHLCASPLVFRARAKELHFFDWHFHYKRGLSWYRRCFPTRRSMNAAGARRGQRAITGEASPYYLFHPLAPARVAAALPKVKVIAMLREPVARAISHHQHAVRTGFETCPFDEAIEGEIERTAALTERIIRDPTFDHNDHENRSYLSQGIYAPQLRRWMEHVPPERMFVLESEAYFADPLRTAGEVMRFLGLPAEPPPAPGRLNEGGYREAIPAPTQERLTRFFARHNEELFALLGRRLEWTKGRS
jgi:Sulfotransferase domain